MPRCPKAIEALATHTRLAQRFSAFPLRLHAARIQSYTVTCHVQTGLLVEMQNQELGFAPASLPGGSYTAVNAGF